MATSKGKGRAALRRRLFGRLALKLANAVADIPPDDVIAGDGVLRLHILAEDVLNAARG